MEILTKKLGYPNEHFSSIEDYRKTVDNLEKEDFFSKLKIDYPDDKEEERLEQTIKVFNFKNREELTQLYLKSDVFLLASVSENFIKLSNNELVLILFVVLVYQDTFGNMV